MSKIQFFILLIISVLAPKMELSAQALKPISMEEAVLRGRTSLAPANLRQLQWIPGSEAFSHVFGDKIVRVQADGLATDTLDWLPKINEGLEKMSLTALKNFPAATMTSATSMRFEQENSVFSFSEIDGLKKENGCPTDLIHLDLHPKSLALAATDEKARVLKIFVGGNEMVVARGEEDGIVVGKSVHRDEFGITKGTFWSPSGGRLAFYRMDERMVTQYPIYELDSMPAKARFIRYPFAGATSHQVTVGVFDLKTRRTIFLETGEPKEQYLTNVSWSADEKWVLVAIVNRAQNRCKLNVYEAETGKFERTILEESNEKWVEPENPAAFIPGQPDRFLWQSERGGFNHLYLYSMKGELIRQVSSGAFPVLKLLGFDPKGTACFYQTADETGLNRYAWRANLATGEVRKLNETEGTHAVSISENGAWCLDNFQDEATPRFIYCQKTDGSGERQLIFGAKNPLEGRQIGSTRLTQIFSPSGVLLNARLVLPPDFDEKKKYPAIVYLYNGPHVQLVTNTWLGGAELWMHRMASLGYVIFTMDGRGSANRGFNFESAIHRQIGTAEMEDQLAGVHFLKDQDFIDTARVGIYGWSYGGFMTTSLMTRAPGEYKVGIAGGPVIDWRMYEIMYTERYMDTPAENPNGYVANNLLHHVEKLRGKLLLIHGTDDDTVLWQHSLNYLKAAVSKGKQVDYFVYPGHAHNVRPGKDRVHLFNKIEGYFLQNL